MQVYKLKDHERIDFVAPARVQNIAGLAVPDPFNNQKEWNCYVFISQKTRTDKAIDDREVFDGYATTQLAYYHSNKVCRGETVQWTQAAYYQRIGVYDFLEKKQQDANLLIVRIHFLLPCGPGESKTSIEDHRLGSWKIGRRMVQLKWRKLFENKTLSFVELSLNIDSTTLSNWKLYSEVTKKNILAKYQPLCMYIN